MTKVRTDIVTMDTLKRAILNTNQVLRTVIQNASKNTSNAQAMKGNASALLSDLSAMEDLMVAMTKEAEEKEKEEAKVLAAAKRAADAKEKAPKITKPQEDEAKTPSSTDAK